MRPVTRTSDVAGDYRYHADAMSTSSCYRAWAAGVAEDREVLARIAELPTLKRQANLVFAAARWHGLRPGPYADLRALLLGPEWEVVRGTILERSTQTNEVGRLTALVPALGLLGDEPLALVELGASAGLCLFPDRYDYSWGGVGGLRGSGGPLLSTRAAGPLPVPSGHPRVVSRTGVDLNPLDVWSDEDTAWLLSLVWPEHDARRRRLAAAVEVARVDPPRILGGDMLERLDDALSVAEASGGVPVVHHSAAAAYLDEPARDRLERRLRELIATERCHWVSLEGPSVLPSLAEGAPGCGEGSLCLAVDGRGVAWADGHGNSVDWW